MQYETTRTYTSSDRQVTYGAARKKGFVSVPSLSGGAAFYWVQADSTELALLLASNWAKEHFPPTETM